MPGASPDQLGQYLWSWGSGLGDLQISPVGECAARAKNPRLLGTRTGKPDGSDLRATWEGHLVAAFLTCSARERTHQLQM